MFGFSLFLREAVKTVPFRRSSMISTANSLVAQLFKSPAIEYGRAYPALKGCGHYMLLVVYRDIGNVLCFIIVGHYIAGIQAGNNIGIFVQFIFFVKVLHVGKAAYSHDKDGAIAKVLDLAYHAPHLHPTIGAVGRKVA